jgi:EmrB/QacA subfamily drug resistance transporter
MHTTVGGLSSRRKLIILLSCCLSLLIVSMDSTIVNVALPAIHGELRASLSQLQWIIDIYTLTLASLLMLAGALADRFGRRRVFQIGLGVFALGSLMCSLAPSVGFLIAARLVQGVGGSMLNPVAMSIITQVFTDRMERARAVGVWGAVVGISTAIGPIVGGLLIDSLGWHAVFWINLPICALAIVLTAIFVPESKSATVRGVDPVGQVLAMVFVFALVFGLIEGPGAGWGSARIIAIFAVSAAALAGFLGYEHRHPSPFIDLRFFRSVPFSAATATAVFAFAAMGSFLFLCSLYLQNVRHYTAVHTGLLYLAMAVGMLVFSPVSGRLVGLFGTRPSLLVSGSLMAVAAGLLTQLRADTPVWALVGAFAIFGVGVGMVNAPITTSAVGGMPIDRAGAASAVASTSRQVGVSLGVALSGSLAGKGLALGEVTSSTATQWWVVTALSVGIVILGVASTSAWGRASQARVAPLLTEPRPGVPAHAR